jgi:hypothetical protein
MLGEQTYDAPVDLAASYDAIIFIAQSSAATPLCTGACCGPGCAAPR